MNILVTGGAGYIGSVATEVLIQAGHEVVVYDSLLYGHREAVHAEAVLEKGDLADKERLNDVFDAHPIDAVMHSAAHSNVPVSMQDPLPFVRDNVSNAINLLEAMATHDVKSFILSSTANVYGDPERVPTSEDAALSRGAVDMFVQSQYSVIGTGLQANTRLRDAESTWNPC
jgi:UDP-glucose 4-epimerase